MTVRSGIRIYGPVVLSTVYSKFLPFPSIRRISQSGRSRVAGGHPTILPGYFTWYFRVRPEHEIPSTVGKVLGAATQEVAIGSVRFGCRSQ